MTVSVLCFLLWTRGQTPCRLLMFPNNSFELYFFPNFYENKISIRSPVINDESLISKGKELHAFVRQGLVIAETLIIPSRSSKIYKDKDISIIDRGCHPIKKSISINI